MEKYDKRIALKTILLAQLFIESLDEMKSTTLFKQGTKNLVNRLDKELTPLVKQHYDKTYSIEVQNSIDVFDIILDEIVHDALIEITDVEDIQLYCLRDSTTGKIVKVKSNLSIAEFELKYGIKLSNVRSI